MDPLPHMTQALAPPLWRGTGAPPCPAGCIEHVHQSLELDAALVCHLEHHPAERGYREPGTGLALEPDSAERLTLIDAYRRGVPVRDLLGADLVREIEAIALAQLQQGEAP